MKNKEISLTYQILAKLFILFIALPLYLVMMLSVFVLWLLATITAFLFFKVPKLFIKPKVVVKKKSDDKIFFKATNGVYRVNESGQRIERLDGVSEFKKKSKNTNVEDVDFIDVSVKEKK